MNITPEQLRDIALRTGDVSVDTNKRESFNFNIYGLVELVSEFQKLQAEQEPVARIHRENVNNLVWLVDDPTIGRGSYLYGSPVAPSAPKSSECRDALSDSAL